MLFRSAGFDAANVAVSTNSVASADRLVQQFGVTAHPIEASQEANANAVVGADVVLVAVKPLYVTEVLRQVSHNLTDGALVISVAAGVTTASMEAAVPESVAVIRSMPNTPAIVGRAVTGVARGRRASEAQLNKAVALFETVGKVVILDENQIDVTVGSHNYRREVGDFNQQTGESSALRVSAMKTTADNNGAGSSIDKQGIAGSYRWGIGERDEFTASLYRLENNNGINYGMPWIKPTSTSPASATTLLPVSPTSNYGMASDYNDGTATYATLAHTHRFDGDTELTTRVRRGAYTRDQRASTIRLTAGENLSNFGPSTVLTRGTQNKIQDLDSVYWQSDLSAKFDALGVRHELLSGIDVAREQKTVYAARTAAQGLGGVDLIKPNTTVGTPDDSAWVNEGSRVLRVNNQYTSTAWGVYAQDLVQIAPHWKLLGGLRYDNLNGNYDTFAAPAANVSNGVLTNYKMNVGEWSKRVGALFQPNERESYHFSAATSFNTSGDAYSLGASNADVPPEQSINLELGAKIDSADKNFTTRYALFRSTKLHERNTDPLVDVAVLSGKRSTKLPFHVVLFLSVSAPRVRCASVGSTCAWLRTWVNHVAKVCAGTVLSCTDTRSPCTVS